MSWYCFEKRTCKQCGKEFTASIDTLSIAAGKVDKCPECGNYSEIPKELQTIKFKE